MARMGKQEAGLLLLCVVAAITLLTCSDKPSEDVPQSKQISFDVITSGSSTLVYSVVIDGIGHFQIEGSEVVTDNVRNFRSILFFAEDSDSPIPTATIGLDVDGTPTEFSLQGIAWGFRSIDMSGHCSWQIFTSDSGLIATIPVDCLDERSLRDSSGPHVASTAPKIGEFQISSRCRETAVDLEILRAQIVSDVTDLRRPLRIVRTATGEYLAKDDIGLGMQLNELSDYCYYLYRLDEALTGFELLKFLTDVGLCIADPSKVICAAEAATTVLINQAKQEIVEKIAGNCSDVIVNAHEFQMEAYSRSHVEVLATRGGSSLTSSKSVTELSQNPLVLDWSATGVVASATAEFQSSSMTTIIDFVPGACEEECLVSMELNQIHNGLIGVPSEAALREIEDWNDEIRRVCSVDWTPWPIPLRQILPCATLELVFYDEDGDRVATKQFSTIVEQSSTANFVLDVDGNNNELSEQGNYASLMYGRVRLSGADNFSISFDHKWGDWGEGSEPFKGNRWGLRCWIEPGTRMRELVVRCISDPEQDLIPNSVFSVSFKSDCKIEYSCFLEESGSSSVEAVGSLSVEVQIGYSRSKIIASLQWQPSTSPFACNANDDRSHDFHVENDSYNVKFTGIGK